MIIIFLSAVRVHLRVLCLEFFHIDTYLSRLLQADDCRDRAIDNMMDGALEVKKEDILRMVCSNIFDPRCIIAYKII